MPTVNFKEHLEKQIGFLERSCAAFDAGAEDEAIRIATVIRVLIHQTKSSTSLLKHLNATTINLMSTCEGAGPNTVMCMGMGVVGIHGDGRTTYKPNLGDVPYIEFVQVSKWWDAVTFVSGETRLSRRNIVLSAANKDGGAHVDHALDAAYAELTTAGFAGSVYHSSAESSKETKLEGSHLVALRQMAYELLHSPQLLELVNG